MIVVGKRGSIFQGRRMYSVTVNKIYVLNMAMDKMNIGVETKIRISGDSMEPAATIFRSVG